jgi:hypothetical protein
MKNLLLYGSTFIALGASPAAHAGEITPPVANYSGVYEQSMVIYLHPATLALSDVPPSDLGDHPAVIVAKRTKQTATLAAVPTLHPALWR